MTTAAQPSRRAFLKTLGGGLLVAVVVPDAFGQEAPPRRGRFGGGAPVSLSARIHIGQDGIVTVMTGKVECGQGSRASIAQAAAEELHLPAQRMQLIMGDTSLSPDDGGTFGSQTTPRTIPVIRQAAAAARQVLMAAACRNWGVPASDVQAADGKIIHSASGRELTYAEIVSEDPRVFVAAPPRGVTVTPVEQWKVLGQSISRCDARDLVTGAHQYPSDIVLPGMLYGKVLRAPSYGAKLKQIDWNAGRGFKDVVAVRLGDFVGVAATNSFNAEQAIDALAKTAKWDAKPQISDAQLYDHLRATSRMAPNPFEDDLNRAYQALRQVYRVAYIQHAPMEPRAAVAQWQDGRLTVWTGTQNPFAVRTALQSEFNLRSPQSVRVIVPDFGGGFGGKHTAETAIEAARLAKAAGRPVWLRWTREEEFTWAYFRPAGVIMAEAGLDSGGAITSWYFVNINSGPSAVNTPYNLENNQCRFVQADAPLRQGSYRGLAATANHFARESFMDELAHAAGVDPLTFRLKHLQDDRLIAVLKAAADKFDFASHWKNKNPAVGIGLACGTEKGSYVAACVETAIDEKQGTIAVRRVCQVFECGKILNPAGLLSQVQGAIVMGIGPALREEVKFENGSVTNGSFTDYRVPRFEDVPELDVQLLDRPDIPPAGAGETPIVAIAPAIANSVFHATGRRVRQMPIRLNDSNSA
jgi:isoquinoline 1-oxidoreductase subunit beta